MGIFNLKLNLSATSFNEVKNKQVREVLQFLVTRVCAQVQDLGHRRGSSSIIKPALFIAESSVVPQCPKGRGKSGSAERATPSPGISAQARMRWHYNGLAGCGNTNWWSPAVQSSQDRLSNVRSITSRWEVQRMNPHHS
jgi:hypothetical protein